MSDNNAPIACSLTSAQLREREATLIAQFRSAVIQTEELQDGYAFRLPGDGQWIGLIAELIAAERECCPFLTFDSTVHLNAGPLILRVTGPCGTKDFLKGIFLQVGNAGTR